MITTVPAPPAAAPRTHTWRATSRLRTAASGARPASTRAAAVTAAGMPAAAKAPCAPGAPTVVVALRRKADAVADAELGRLTARAPALDPGARDEVKLAIQRVVDAFLSAPITRLTRHAGSALGDSYADALSALFALDGADPTPGHRSGRTT